MTTARLATDVFVVSVQIGVVIAVAGALAFVVRIDAAAVRYQYWRALIVLCLVLPWIERRRAATSGLDPRSFTFPATAFVLSSSTGVSAHAPGMSWVEAALWIIAAGIAVRLVRVAYGFVRLRRVRRSGELAAANLERDELQAALGTQAEIRYVPHGQPVTCGVWRPVVLLPESLTSQPPDVQRAVLTHELLHVKRRDWIWMVGEEVLRAALWFHPGIWWLVGRVRLAREEVVDELTVCVTGRRRAYLEALLAFADLTPFAGGAAFARRRHLFRRMTLISKEAVMSSRRIAVSCVALVLGVAAGSWYAVNAFPLMAQAPGVQPAVSQSDRLEQNAKAITPENPIPRRLYSVLPQYPGGETVDSVVVLRVTLNALGRVGEVRATALMSGVSVRDGRVFANAIATADTGVSLSNPFAKAGLDAVRQWVYEPPADAPVSFDVALLFARGSETREIAHGTPPLVERSRDTAGRGVVPPPPPPPPPPAAWTRDGVTIGNPVRVAGDVKPPIKVKDVKAVYPPMAQSAKVQGVVILETVIGVDGRVDQLRVLRSIPLLDQAAMDAVKEWEFEPSTLNGVPVPVIVTISVSFTLK
jgi:TonB family protein